MALIPCASSRGGWTVEKTSKSSSPQADIEVITAGNHFATTPCPPFPLAPSTSLMVVPAPASALLLLTTTTVIAAAAKALAV